jgi:serine protease AprX
VIFLNRVRKIVNIDYVYNIGITGKGVGIAVLDTGIAGHSDINKNIVCFKDYINNSRNIYDDNGHGTHVSGIIAGSGGKSGGKYRGAAPGASIIMIKCLDKYGNGKRNNVLKGFEFIKNNREKYNIRIVNISVGAINNANDDENISLIEGVEQLWNDGLIVVAAAGNNGPNGGSITAPGCSKSIITVGASDDNIGKQMGGRQNYSGRGPTDICIIKPEIVCPGTGIVSCNNRNGYSRKSGTSMATPVVTGIISLMLQKNMNLTNKDVKKILYENAVDIGLNKSHQGWGQIDAKKIINKI